MKEDGHVINSIGYATELEAFDEYRKIKLAQIRRLATHCLNNNSITPADHMYIIRYFEIYPYNN